MTQDGEKWWVTHRPAEKIVGSEVDEQTKRQHQEEMVKNLHSLELIQQIGWTKYHELLSQMSYADIIEHQLTPIETGLKGGESHWYQDHRIIHDNEAELQLIEEEYPKLQSNDQAHFWREGDKKIWMQGENIIKEPSLMRRIYLACPTSKAWHVFQDIISKTTDQGIAKDLSIALNMESFHPGAIAKPFETNNIVIYVGGEEKNDIMTKLAAVLDESKKTEENWKMPVESLAKCQEETLREMTIPIDEQISYVEMKSDASYHTQELMRIKLFYNLQGIYNGHVQAAPLVQYPEKMRARVNTSLIEGRMSYRRSNMPALVNKE